MPPNTLFISLFQPTILLLANILIGIIVGAGFLYAFRNGLDSFLTSSTSVHITLCVSGYHLLMAQAILSLAPENGWSAKLNLVQKRRAHWILQLTGSILAISGSFYKIMDKGGNHWNTWHGIFALVALVFVSASLVNGLTSLYAFELRNFLPANASKLTHICFGIIAFSSSSISLIFGFLKNGFQSWASPAMANAIISFAVILTFTVILVPVTTLYRKSRIMIKMSEFSKMPPNSIDIPLRPVAMVYEPVPSYENRYGIKLFQAFTLQFANILVGIVVGSVYLFAFRNQLPLGSTPTHAVLCVTGYQLLMGQGILSMAPENGWTSRMKLVHKRRVHFIMQIMGSGLAIGGTFYKIIDSRNGFSSWHGTCGLVALVFTSISLVNGLASLYAYELRRFLPSTLSKITHVCFGMVAFIFASITLCLGMRKGPFVNSYSDPLSYTIISFVVLLLVIIITNPLITFFGKVNNVVKKF